MQVRQFYYSSASTLIDDESTDMLNPAETLS